MKIQKMKIPTILGALLVAGTLSAGAQMNSDSLYKEMCIRDSPYTIGVSAGACNGLSYMSGQRGRAKYSNIDLLEKYNYIGLKYLLKKRNIMAFDLLFQEFPEHILPYDYEAYFHCPERYVMVTTNCETGEAKDVYKRQVMVGITGIDGSTAGAYLCMEFFGKLEQHVKTFLASHAVAAGNHDGRCV